MHQRFTFAMGGLIAVSMANAQPSGTPAASSAAVPADNAPTNDPHTGPAEMPERGREDRLGFSAGLSFTSQYFFRGLL